MLRGFQNQQLWENGVEKVFYNSIRTPTGNFSLIFYCVHSQGKYFPGRIITYSWSGVV
jgi:hypothetical protein